MRQGARTTLPTREEVLGLLEYEPGTGALRWRRSAGPVKAGSAAGYVKSHGYVVVGMWKRLYLAHRLAWLVMTGEWPPEGHEVDHRNRNRSDNRWSNLRLATRSQQLMNAGAQSNSRTGVRGVRWCKQTQKWAVQIKRNGKYTTVGRYQEFDVAVQVRRAAERDCFGEFAPEHGVSA